MTIAILLFLLLLIVVAYRQRYIGLTIWMVLTLALFAFTGQTTFMILGIVLGCLLLGQPLFVLMGTLTLASFYFIVGYQDAETLTVVVDKILELASKEVLLAIPFFVVAGEVMTQGSLAERLINVARAVFGFMPGGLAVAAVAGCIFFAAISGSSPVTVIAIGSIMVPALIKSAYPERFSIGLLTSAGSLGILIPPSIPMIVYAIMVGTSTPMDPKDLFLGGVVPGALIGGMLAAYSIYTGARHNLPRDPFDVKHIAREMARGFWSLMLPVIILGGIYSGVFTTTEAAAVSVVYALAVEMLVHRELKPKDLVGVAQNSMTVMGALLLIIGLAIGLNHVLVEQQVPERLVEWLQTLDLSRTGFLIITNIFLLILGCFMDIMSAILIVAPMLSPMANSMEIEPIHMGIIFIVNLEIGYLTPPLGLNLFVSSTLFRKPLGEIIKSVVVPIAILFAGLLLITWVPVLSTGLPRVLNGEPLFPEDKPAEVEQPEQPEAPSQGKTLEELMKATQGGEGEGEGEAGDSKPKTLEELMKEAEGQPSGDASEAAKPKTLEELMRDAEAKDPSGAVEEAAPPQPTTPPKPKSLEELMKEAEARDPSGSAP